MSNNKTFPQIAAALLMLAVVIALTQVWGIPLKNFVVGITTYALFGLLIVAYLLRFALIFLGVFAFYRMLQKRYYSQANI